MKYLQITGEQELKGSVKISGAKNATLPILAACLLIKGKVTLTNIPLVSDIYTMIELLSNLGAKCLIDKHSVCIDSSNITSTKALYEIVSKMRASILVLGPLLSRFNECEVSLPGGCAIGQRPIDLHLKALAKLGAKIELKEGYVKASGKLKAANITFDKITVGGTENAILAAVYAEGVTIINNAAMEPEIINLCEFLELAGVKIEGIGSKCLKIHGVKELKSDFTCKIIPDRIEAGTYLCAGAITNSEITITNVNPNHLLAVIDKLNELGVMLDVQEDKISTKKYKKLNSCNIQTSEYPGFPTDMQAQFMALCLCASSDCIIDERLFENRFMHVAELQRMGANISLNNHLAIVKPSKLSAAQVMATDLRASSALVLAALAAKGTSKISRIYHLQRGYEDLCLKLQSLGAKISLKDENDDK